MAVTVCTDALVIVGTVAAAQNRWGGDKVLAQSGPFYGVGRVGGWC
jgi:hypothetical protein